MATDFDVVIVGARCAGAATALLLARAGARVLVIDRGAYGTDTLSTHALMRGAVLQLQRWGVLPALVAAGTPAVRRTTFGYPTEAVTIAIEPREGVDALYAPRRALLDRTLADAARDSGAEFLYGTVVEDVTRDAAGRVSGVVVKTDGVLCRIAAELTIGADGLRSTIAHLVEAPILIEGRSSAGVLYSYFEGLDIDGYQWHFRPGVSVGAIPTNAATLIFVSLPSSRFADAVRGHATDAYYRLLRTTLPTLAATLDDARRVESVRGFPGRAGFFRRSTGTGWALVGDAGYFKDPITAHGITDAFRDADLLARAVLAGTTQAFAEYEATRHDLSHRLFEVTDEIASFEWTDARLAMLHRAFSKEMSREVRALASLEPLTCLSSLANAPHVV